MPKKRLIILIGIAVVVIIASVSILTILARRRLPSEIRTEDISYKVYLKAFLEGTGLSASSREKEGFVYYELRNADGDGQGFIFLGEEKGYGGPIRLFVKVDLEGIIQRVHVWEHTETPVFMVGLGEFLDTFANQKIDAELKWQTDIHGLTGATVTAESIIRGVRQLGIMAKEKEIYVP